MPLNQISDTLTKNSVAVAAAVVEVTAVEEDFTKLLLESLVFDDEVGSRNTVATMVAIHTTHPPTFF